MYQAQQSVSDSVASCYDTRPGYEVGGIIQQMELVFSETFV